MIPLHSLKLSMPSFLKRKKDDVIKLSPVRVWDIESSNEKSARTLKHLLRLNHANNSILYNNLRSQNTLPHILASAYILGSSGNHLEAIYESISQRLEKWSDSPSEVTIQDWNEFLGDGRYQRAYVDFFEDELTTDGYEWRDVVERYLFQSSEPLFHSLVSGYGNPLVHLAYAYELSSKDLAMEALSMAATSQPHLHLQTDKTPLTRGAHGSAISPHEILQKAARDKRLDGLLGETSASRFERLITNHQDTILEYWNTWISNDILQQFRESQITAVSLLVATPVPREGFFDHSLAQIVVTSHAVRVILPLTPPEYQVALLRQWWYLTVVLYVSRPYSSMDNYSILDYETQASTWASVNEKVLGGEHWEDTQFVRVMRALQDSSDKWGDENDFFLKAAVRFCEKFRGWEDCDVDHHNEA